MIKVPKMPNVPNMTPKPQQLQTMQSPGQPQQPQNPALAGAYQPKDQYTQNLYKHFAQGYDPNKVDETTRGMNEAIVSTLGRQWGHGNIQYDPTTGKVKTTGAYAGRGVDPVMYQYIERAKAKFFRDSIRNKALDNYKSFDVDNYVRGEADSYRRNLASQLQQQQSQLAGNENARGMLFSGRKQKGEMGLNQAAEQNFAGYRNDLVQDALKQKQALAADPLLGAGNLSLQALENKFRSMG